MDTTFTNAPVVPRWVDGNRWESHVEAANREAAELIAERDSIPFSVAPASDDPDAALVCTGSCTPAGIDRIAAINQRVANLRRFVANVADGVARMNAHVRRLRAKGGAS